MRTWCEVQTGVSERARLAAAQSSRGRSGRLFRACASWFAGRSPWPPAPTVDLRRLRSGRPAPWSVATRTHASAVSHGQGTPRSGRLRGGRSPRSYGRVRGAEPESASHGGGMQRRPECQCARLRGAPCGRAVRSRRPPCSHGFPLTT